VLFIRFSRFALVGATATSIQYVILFILVHWVKSDPVLASSLGFILSASVNYILNYHYTFRSSQQHGPAVIKFMTLASVGLILNSIIMQFLTQSELHYLIAQLCTTFVVLFWNYSGNALWTFRSATDQHDQM